MTENKPMERHEFVPHGTVEDFCVVSVPVGSRPLWRNCRQPRDAEVHQVAQSQPEAAPLTERERVCGSCRIGDHNDCDVACIDGFCCCNDLDTSPVEAPVAPEGETCRWKAAPSSFSRNGLEWVTSCEITTEIFNSCHKFCGFCGKAISHE